MKRSYVTTALFTVLLALGTQFSSAKVVVLSGLTNTHGTDVGSQISGEVQLKNIGDTEERILVYLNDLVQDCHSQASYQPAGTHSRSLGNWIELSTSEKVLAANEEYTLKYNITVPDDQELSGSYWSLIMIEIAEPIKEDNLEYGIAMNSKIRYGIQVITDIGSSDAVDLQFSTVRLEKTEEGHVVIATAENLSEYLVTPTVVLELFDNKGGTVVKSEVPFKKVYPGSCKEFEVPIQKIKKGNYDALLVADYGKDLYGTNLQLELK